MLSRLKANGNLDLSSYMLLVIPESAAPSPEANIHCVEKCVAAQVYKVEKGEVDGQEVIELLSINCANMAIPLDGLDLRSVHAHCVVTDSNRAGG